MNFISGKCGTDRNNLLTGFNLFMNETFEVKLNFKFQQKWIKLSGKFDRKLCEMKGNFKASSNLEGTVCTSGDN